MAVIIETGHHKNLQNFKFLVAFVLSYGTKYNPQASSYITTSKLNTIVTQATAVLELVKEKDTTFNNQTNVRQIVFKPIRTFASQIMGALKVAGASAEELADAKTIIAKIRGTRLSVPKLKDSEAADANLATASSVSVSQVSYDSLIEHMEKLYQIAAQNTSYAPNEAELMLTGIQNFITGLHTANDAVKTAYVAVTNARNQRTSIFYSPASGLVQVASLVKAYLLQVYTASAPEYKQVNKINFRTLP